MAHVVNKRTARPGVNDVYIGRPGPFQNPFEIGKDGTRAEVLIKYRAYFFDRVRRDSEFRKAVLALRGKRLVCWCKPLACHGDVIVEYLAEVVA